MKKLRENIGIPAFLVVVLLLTAASLVTWSVGPPPKDDVAVQALTSSPGGVPTTSTGAGPQFEWFYDYNATAGSPIADSICVNFTMTDKNGVAESKTFGFNPVGSGTAFLTVTPSPNQVTVSDPGVANTAGTTQQVCFALSGTPTTTGDFALNIQINSVPASDANDVHLSHTTIHIHIHVAPASAISCFVTDSSFNFLLDCGNAEVTSGDGGRFTIQVNKGKTPVEVSTQPGQFYYNVLWTNNTGSDVTVNVTFSRTGVHPHGTQAIHASVFPSFPAFAAYNFDTVNNDIPSGADDILEGVLVPAGTTLWVDYHLEWNGLGAPPPTNLATACGGANQSWSVSATVFNASDSSTLAGPCAAGAVGYKK